jgi:hypothetical protein
MLVLRAVEGAGPPLSTVILKALDLKRYFNKKIKMELVEKLSEFVEKKGIFAGQPDIMEMDKPRQLRIIRGAIVLDDELCNRAIGDDEIRDFCDICDFFVRKIGIYGWDNLTGCSGTPTDSDYQAAFARVKYCPCASVKGVNVELFDKGATVPIK